MTIMTAVLNPNDFALTVGIDHYSMYRCLSGAIKDAEDFHKWLVEPDGGGLDPNNRRLVLSPPVQKCSENYTRGREWSTGSSCEWFPRGQRRRPVKSEIDEDLDELVERARQRVHDEGRRMRRFYYFFSGHGNTHNERSVARTSYCLARWSRDQNRSDALDIESYLGAIGRLGLFEEVLMFLDFCRINQVSVSGSPSIINPPMGGAAVESFVAYAADVDQAAYEGDGGSNGLDFRGHFSRVLMKALRGAAASEGGGVTILDLATYLDRNVPKVAKRHHHEQGARFDNKLSPPRYAGSVLGSARPGLRIRLRFKEGRSGTYRLVGPDLRVIHAGDVGIGPWELSLDARCDYEMIDEGGRAEVIDLPVGGGVHDVEF
jgi:hypothetical protein